MTQANANIDQDWSAIAGFLDGQGHRLDRDFEIKQLSGGSANYNFLISMNDEKAVLRRPPDGPLPPGSNDVAREYKVLSRLGDAFPAAPRGLVYCDDTSVIGVPFCISEFREGVCITRELPEVLQGRPNIGYQLSELSIDTLALLHRVDTDAVGLSDLGKLDGFLERQIGGWYKRGTRVLNDSQMEKMGKVRNWLTAHLPQSRVGALVHNDYKLDNMLIDPETLTVSGVVDWDMCTLGDPYYELAILMAYWGDKGDPELYDYQIRMPHKAEGWWTRQAAIRHYYDKMGDGISAKELSFYWWLMQYRTVVVYAQLSTLFKRQGASSSFTMSDLERIDGFYTDLLDFVSENVATVPEFLDV